MPEKNSAIRTMNFKIACENKKIIGWLRIKLRIMDIGKAAIKIGKVHRTKKLESKNTEDICWKLLIMIGKVKTCAAKVIAMISLKLNLFVIFIFSSMASKIG